jgi:2,5-diamino-6-(ribosylamino)-4(3H)-pyrimidinone 5'-phosphate reductase
VLINMVTSLDGKATAGGRAGSIGSRTDRYLMRSLRAQSDAVMVGAGTLRAEKLRLDIPEGLARPRAARCLKPQPLAVIATGSGDCPLESNLLGSSPDNLLVLAPPGLPEGRLAALSSRARVEVVPNGAGEKAPRLDLEKALETLKGRYAVDVLLVEGGPSLNHAFISKGFADELFLTLAPKLLGGQRPGVLSILEGPPLPGGTEPGLVSVHLSGDELFLRYALLPPGPTRPRAPIRGA